MAEQSSIKIGEVYKMDETNDCGQKRMILLSRDEGGMRERKATPYSRIVHQIIESSALALNVTRRKIPKIKIGTRAQNLVVYYSGFFFDYINLSSQSRTI